MTLEVSLNSCRACLVEIQTVSADTNNERHKSIFFFVTGHEVLHNEPQSFCTSCLNDLTCSNEFKKRCDRTQEILSKLASDVKTETLDGDDKDHIDVGMNVLEYADVQCKVEAESSSYEARQTNDVMTFESDRSMDSEPYDEMVAPTKAQKRKHEVKQTKHRKKQKSKEASRFGCSICYETFQTTKSLGTHLKSLHKGKESARCEFCNKPEFIDLIPDHVSKCQKNLAKNTPVVCPDCGVLIPPARLNAHIKSKHSTAQPFKCDLCGINLKTKSSVLIHMRIVHLNFRFKCTECDETFRLPFNRNCHLRKAHTDKYGLFQCDYCEYSTHSRSHLKRHTKAHQGLASRTYKCNQCSLSFYMQYHLKEHMATHSDNRPHVCETCAAAFKTRRNLLVHKKSHLEHQYECPVCQRRFLTNQIMRNHCTKQHPDYNLPPPGTIMNKGALQRIAEGKVPITQRLLKPVMLITPELAQQSNYLPNKPDIQ